MLYIHTLHLTPHALHFGSLAYPATVILSPRKLPRPLSTRQTIKLTDRLIDRLGRSSLLSSFIWKPFFRTWRPHCYIVSALHRRNEQTPLPQRHLRHQYPMPLLLDMHSVYQFCHPLCAILCCASQVPVTSQSLTPFVPTPSH